MKTIQLLFMSLTVTIMTAQAPNWSVNESNFEHSMTRVSFLNVNGQELSNTNDKVAAFINDEVRGVANLVDVSGSSRNYAYLTVFANQENQTVKYKIYNSTTDAVVDVPKTDVFRINDHQGNLFQAFSVADPSLNDKADILDFGFEGEQELKVTVNDSEVIVKLDKTVSLDALVADFQLSKGAQLWYNEQRVQPGAIIDLNNPKNYQVRSEDESLVKNWKVSVELDFSKDPAIITAGAVQTFTYDGKIKNTTASLNHGETELTYSPQQGYTDAGTFPVTITASETDNYLEASKNVSLIIEKADIKGVTFNDAIFTYDGTVKAIQVSGLPKGANVSYANNEKTSAGTYEVTAIVSKDNFNDLKLSAKLVINKAAATITADAIQTFTYDGNLKNVTANLNHTETALSYMPKKGFTNAGIHNITVFSVETKNYKTVSKSIQLVINKAPQTITFEDAVFTYDGTPKTIQVNNLPDGAIVSYVNNNKTNAGSYLVTATISQNNFNDLEISAGLIINKAEAKITANATQTFTYDGEFKNITASLNHDETELTYSPQQSYSNAGTYPVTVIASETDNYLEASKRVSLTVEPATQEGLVFNDKSFTYDTTSKSLEVTEQPDGATVIYENNDQTDVGNYIVTATITHPNFTEKVLEALLSINKAPQTIAFDSLAAKNAESDPDFQLNATSSSGLPLTYTYSYISKQPAALVSPSGFVELQTSGQIQIKAKQAGNTNYQAATAVKRTLVINSSSTSASSVTVNGEVYNKPEDQIHYLINCNDDMSSIDISFETDPNAQLNTGPNFTLEAPAPGVYRQEVVVTSQDGTQAGTYMITVEKPFNFEAITVQKYNNTLVINNNPDTNGGYTFVAYEWFKNGKSVGKGQTYSEGNGASDVLDTSASYTVKMRTVDGDILQTCEASIELKNSFSIAISENPISQGRSLKVLADYPSSELKGAVYYIYSIDGKLIKSHPADGHRTSIDVSGKLPSGMYRLMLVTPQRKVAENFIKN